MFHVFYLHGFASSPSSSKATFLKTRLAGRGCELHVPDFNLPEFRTLTISRMLQQLAAAVAQLPAGKVMLIGSSLGGFVAVEAAAAGMGGAQHKIDQLVLLAPAVELQWEKWDEVGPGGIERWRKRGSIDVFHHSDDRMTSLDSAFYEDAVRYNPATRILDLPMVIVQGRDDESVDPISVERFARAQPRAELHMVPDGHQLSNSLELIWKCVESRLEARSA